MKGFSHSRWIKEIGDLVGESDTRNIIIYALSYTLQSLKSEEDMKKFQWDDSC